MTKQELIQEIIEKDWNMFHSVNGDDRTDCQDDRPTFDLMRRAQYDAWDEASLNCYYNDLCTAEAEGRNLAREKYIRMMRSTDPRAYEAFKGELPEMSEHKAALVLKLWRKYLAQTLRMREKYPLVAMGGRPTYAVDEEDGWPSVETYQTSETMTYSEATLEALLAHFDALEARGIDLVFEIQRNTVLGMGFSSMEEAEAASARHWSELPGSLGKRCCSCGQD